MAVVHGTASTFVMALLLKSIVCSKISVAEVEGRNSIVNCSYQLVLKYFEKGSEITFVDMSRSGDGDDILIGIHENLHVLVISRTPSTQLSTSNEGYIIYVKKACDFVRLFNNITKEAMWNPHVRFIVVVDSDENDLKVIFDTLLEYHVINVVILIGIHNDLYTYNPFENYGCGRRFQRIIHYGTCNNCFDIDLFADKLETGLKNCTFNIAAPHWPPYIIDPSTNISKNIGIEQYIFELISEIEQFNTNYTYTDDAENFTVINEEMSAVGPMQLLQNNKTDIIFGGMLLIKTRANAFDYIYSHLAYVDEIKLLVKKAGFVSSWKNIYLEFRPTVWISIAISFLIYYYFLILIRRGNDKTYVLLQMWDSLFTHARTIGNSRAVKCAFIAWIWFAYLVNTFYQSNLVSLTTHPAKDYQISNEQDLVDYNMEPCNSVVIRTLMWAELGLPLKNSTDDCQGLLQSIRTVIDKDNLYTTTLYSIFLYNRFNFFDKFGNSLLYEFPAFNKVIYAIYFYKGFPLQQKLHCHALRLRESGLIEQVTKYLDYEETIKHFYSKESTNFNITVPWYIYLAGVGIAIFAFAIEIIKKRYTMIDLLPV